MYSQYFDNLVDNLRKNGYTVTVEHEEECYRFAIVDGKQIHGGFCEPNNGESYTYIDGRIAFDNSDCFVKWNKCPYSFPIPKTVDEFNYILSKMQYLSTEEGYNKSDNYELDWERDYPEDTNKVEAEKKPWCATCGVISENGDFGIEENPYCPKCKQWWDENQQGEK